MNASFSNFSGSLLLNYWNSARDSIVVNFLKENIPFILNENIGYTAYSGITYNDEDIKRQIKSIFFKGHPHFESTYFKVSFSLLVKLHADKCIGHDSAEVTFFYKTNDDLKISLNNLKARFLDFHGTKIANLPNNIIEIISGDDKNWPSSVFLKIEKNTDDYTIIFSASKLFF